MKLTIELSGPQAEILQKIAFMAGITEADFVVQALDTHLQRDLSVPFDVNEILDDAIHFARSKKGLKKRCEVALRDIGSEAARWYDRARLDIIIDRTLGEIDDQTAAAMLQSINLSKN